MNTYKNERDIEITYNDNENENITAILEAVYEAAGLLYTANSVSDTAVA